MFVALSALVAASSSSGGGGVSSSSWLKGLGFQGGYPPWQDRVFRLRSHGSVHALCRNPILQSAHCSLFSAHCSPLACVKWCLAVKEEKKTDGVGCGNFSYSLRLMSQGEGGVCRTSISGRLPCVKIGRCTLIKRVELRKYMDQQVS